MTPTKYIILLHGLGRTHRSLSKLEKHLQEEGYEVCNVPYQSRSLPIEDIVEHTLAPALLNFVPPNTPVSFVTHSMGGILVRHLLNQNPNIQVDKVVMLGPPNTGSEAVDQLQKIPFVKTIMGPAFTQLSTAADSVPNQLSRIPGEIGIIAANRSLDPITSLFLPGEHDGKVPVARTTLPEMRDHIVVNSTHVMMMNSKNVINQVLHFLQHGIFFKK